jgi:hypothetical protein
MVWNFSAVNDVMRRCHGSLILGFPRRRFQTEKEEARFPTEYNHYEGALANSLKILVLTQLSSNEFPKPCADAA